MTETIQRDILRTLLYYDIWQFPLSAGEILRYFPGPPPSPVQLQQQLVRCADAGMIGEADGFYFVRGRTREVVERRTRNRRRAARMWKAAKASAAVIKSFPFVRAVFVSGELSMDVASRRGDIDFMILTEPGRLWIARCLLIGFKKIFLFNRKKFFCLNYFVSASQCELDSRSIYAASEVAHLKPLYNAELFRHYLSENRWIRTFFPGYAPDAAPPVPPSDRRSILQRILEAPFALLDADRLDDALMTAMRRVWARRYPQYDEETRNRIFRSTKSESRAHCGDFEFRVLALYEERLREFGLAD